MKKLDLYIPDENFVKFLQQKEIEKRGFTRIPNFSYSSERKQKFLCGIVAQLNNHDYYVPISSYKTQQENNILIFFQRREPVIGSLRFNYMFPIPKECVKRLIINDIEDEKYRRLVFSEYQFIQKNTEKIIDKAQATYRQIKNKEDIKLMENSCDFEYLESILDGINYVENEENFDSLEEIEELNEISDLENDEDNDTFSDCTITPASFLTGGWNWREYEDGSGRLELEDKKSYFNYDLLPYNSVGGIEYRRPEDDKWDVYYGDFQSFKEFAEDCIKSKYLELETNSFQEEDFQL